MVVDSVIRHWVTVAMPTEAGTGGLGLTIIDLVVYLYAYDGLLTSTHLERLQRVFDVLASLFGRVGLRTNMAKTVGMVCHTCHAPGGMSEEAYA